VADVTPSAPAQTVHPMRIRIGVLLILISWLPIAQVLIWASGASSDQADRVRLVTWSIQILIGLVGVAVAGRETVRLAKSVGWRRLPRAVWVLLRSPQ
jgi:hypothetical protein